MNNTVKSAISIRVEGMSCGGCVRSVTAALKTVEGITVDSVEVGRVRLQTDGQQLAHALQAMTDAGFQPHVEPHLETSTT